MAKAFCWLFLWNFKEKASTIFYDTAENSGSIEKTGKRFHPDHAGRRKLGSGFGNAAGQLDAQAGGKGGIRQDMQFQPPCIDEAQAEIRLRQSR